MGNPASLKDSALFDPSVGGAYPTIAMLDAFVNSGVQTLGLDTDRSYSLAHDGLDHNGNTDTNTIVISVSGINSLSDNKSALYKSRLLNNRPLTVGPGVSTLFFRATNGGPQFTVIASEKFNGRF